MIASCICGGGLIIGAAGLLLTWVLNSGVAAPGAGAGTCEEPTRVRVFVVDVSDPRAPVEVGALVSASPALGVAVAGTTAYVAAGRDGLVVVDVSEPGAPVELGRVRTKGFASAVVLSGSYALVAGERAGLRVVDVSDPASPVEVGHLDTRKATLGIDVANRRTHVLKTIQGRVDSCHVVDQPAAGRLSKRQVDLAHLR